MATGAEYGGLDLSEVTKVIDGVYKNILENFNPATRQMIATGKAYLKSLHGASSACSVYLENLVRLSRLAQASSLGNSNDIGASLIQMTDIFKEIHNQQLVTLKAFYVDFLVPLEANLEKDTRVIQNEQKKFLMDHKQRIESYNKAATCVKKMRKKSKKPSPSVLDKEIKLMQHLEDEKVKLESFCEKAMKEALTQERRRYGFILERQASLAKHFLAFHSKGSSLLNAKLEQCIKVSKARETLPETLQYSLLRRIQGTSEEECIYCNPKRGGGGHGTNPPPAPFPSASGGGVGVTCDDTASINSQIRKTKSMDASEMINIQSEQDYPLSNGGGGGTLGRGEGTMSRAKSDLSLTNAGGGMYNGNGPSGSDGFHNHSEGFVGTYVDKGSNTDELDHGESTHRPKSLNVGNSSPGGVGGPSYDGNSYRGYSKALYAYLSSGENQLSFLEGDAIALIGEPNKGWQFGQNLRTLKKGWFPLAYTEVDGSGSSHSKPRSPMPPPMPPPPIATMRESSVGANLPMHASRGVKGSDLKSPCAAASTQTNLMIPHNNNSASGPASDSLHSSNDSGFSNDLGHGNIPIPPPQPEIDYSDDEPPPPPALPSSGERDPGKVRGGDKWLMDRYHMSSRESMKMGGRRSLSYSNVSAAELASGNNNVMSIPAHYGAPPKDATLTCYVGSPQLRQFHKQPMPSQRLGIAHHHHHQHHPHKDGTLKRLLNRTKSLIFRKGPYDEHFDSISTAVSMSELWGSYNSIVDVGYTDKNAQRVDTLKETVESAHMYTPEAPLPNTGRNRAEQKSQMRHEKKPLPCPEESDNESDRTLSNDIKDDNLLEMSNKKGKGNEIFNRDRIIESQREAPNFTPPPPPPMPDKGICKNKGAKRNCGGSVDTPPSSSASSSINEPEEEDLESCIVISDHMMQQPMKGVYDSYSSHKTYSHKSRRSNKSVKTRSDIFNHFAPVQGPINSPGSEKSGKSEKSKKRDQSRSHKSSCYKVQRVHSFDESPIVPTPSSGGKLKGSSRSQKLKKSLEESYRSERGRDSEEKGSNNYEDEFEIQEESHDFTTGNEFDEEDFEDFELDTHSKDYLSRGKDRGSKGKSSFGRKNGFGYNVTRSSKRSSRNGGKNNRSSMRRKNEKSNSNKPNRTGTLDAPPPPPPPPMPNSSAAVKAIKATDAGARVRGSIRSEIHTVEVVANDSSSIFDYGDQIRRRLYHPETMSRFDEKSERSGNMYGPWYDLWGEDDSVTISTVG